MTVDAIYELIIEHLVQGYLVRLEHYDYPIYKANDGNQLYVKMLLEISDPDTASIEWDDFEGGHGTACWDHTELFDKYECR